MTGLLSRIMNPTSIRLYLGRNKRRYGRGTEYVSVLLLIIANAKLFETTFQNITIGSTPVGFWGGVFIIGCVYGTFCWTMGWVDEHWGIWKQENDYGWVVTPIIMDLIQAVDDIKKDVKSIKAEVETNGKDT